MLAKLIQNKKILYTIVGFLPLSISLIFTPIYINYLTVEDYGFLNLYNTIIGLIAPVLHFGVKDGFGFLYWKNNDTNDEIEIFFKKSITSILVFQLVFLSFFFFVASFVFGYFFDSFKDENFKPFFYVACFYAFFLNFNDLFFYYFRNSNNTRQFLFLNLGSLILMTFGSLLGVVVFKAGLAGAIFGKFIGFALVVLFFLIQHFKTIKLDFDIKFSKQIILSGFPILLSSMLGSYFISADKYYLQKNYSLNSIGIYSVGFTVMYLIDVFLTSSMHFLLPDLLIKIKQNVEDVIITRLINNFFYLLALFCFLVLAVCPIVFNFFPSEYKLVLFYLPFICLIPFVKFLYTINSLNFYLYQKSHVFLLLQIATALTLLFVYNFIPSNLNISGAIIIGLAYHFLQLLFSYLALIYKRKFYLKSKRYFLHFFITTFLLITLGVGYFYFQNELLFFAPFITYLIIILVFERNVFFNLIKSIRNTLD